MVFLGAYVKMCAVQGLETEGKDGVNRNSDF